MDRNIDFKKEIANFVFTSRYAKYNEKLQRRETWEESADRVQAMHLKKFHYLEAEYIAEIKWAFDMVKQKKVVPSMRSLQFGGKGVDSKNLRIFNCSVRHIDSLRSFSEIFFTLLCGTGVGFGVSKYFLVRLPNLVSKIDKKETVLTYVIEDDIEGWADSLEALLMCYFENTPFTGKKIVFDYSKIRRKGEPIKTGGGKAPGHLGLKHAHRKIKELLEHITEELHVTRLRPIHAYDTVMHISDAVLSGGIRRSASICIFDKDDVEMMDAKTFFAVDKIFRFSFDDEIKKWCGKVKANKKTFEVELSDYEYKELNDKKKISWFYIEPQRGRSNNSVLLLRKDATEAEFKNLMQRTKEFGEPGFIFANHPHQLANPCVEIQFIPVTEDGQCGFQMCNLSSINGAKVTSVEDFRQAAKAASILGTLQAAYTYFPYFSPVSEKLTTDEALLGVSITGMMDNPEVLLSADNQREAAKICVEVNKRWAKALGINQAARVTCVKPEGSSSLALESASGIHPHHAKRYFRRIQCNKLDPIYKFFKKTNPHMCEESLWSATKTDGVVTFPIQISEKALVKKDLTALKHLEYIKSTQQNWVNPGTTAVNKKPIYHSVSCTVIVQTEEWDAVEKYIYDNKDYFSAVSLIPATGDKMYVQAPMEEVTTPEDEAKWIELVSKYTHVDYKGLEESEDKTNLAKEVACAGGACEIL